MEKHSDQQLISAYLKGDEKSLEVLIKRYLKQIYGFTYKYVRDAQNAEDITQEVFVKVWKNIRKFNKQKDFKPWIYAIAKNTSLDFLKKKKPLLFSEMENGKNAFVENIRDKSLLPDKIAEQLDINKILISEMNKLSAKYRLVLSLYYNDCFNFREIAKILGESLNTVKSRHRRGLILLRELISSP